MERAKEATRAAEMVRRLDPFIQGRNSFLLFRDPADAARVTKGLRKAGLE